MATKPTLNPIWADMKTLCAITGMNDKIVYKLVADGRLDMRKLGDKRQSRTVFRVADALDWIEMRG